MSLARFQKVKKEDLLDEINIVYKWCFFHRCQQKITQYKCKKKHFSSAAASKYKPELLAHGLQDITATRATNKEKQAITGKIRSAY